MKTRVFGRSVLARAKELVGMGMDPIKVSDELFKADKSPLATNLGIGVCLGENGRPMRTSSVLHKFLKRVCKKSLFGYYVNSSEFMEALKKEVLLWQGIPEFYWEHFLLVLPSDSGTGAVNVSVETALMRNPDLDTLGVEAYGWSVYKTMARVKRVGFKEFEVTGVVGDRNPKVLPLYQASALNGTGLVRSLDCWQDRALYSNIDGKEVVLDRAYSVFEQTRLLRANQKYSNLDFERLAKVSFEQYIKPFLEHGVTTYIPISPTKTFITFDKRPAGFLLVYVPHLKDVPAMKRDLAEVIRTRGCSSEHPVTRAFVRAFVANRKGLEKEHFEILLRLRKAEEVISPLVRNTALSPLFLEMYASLFRNFLVRAGADVFLYDHHLYPVFSNEGDDLWCRINLTGISSDPARAEVQLDLLASQMI